MLLLRQTILTLMLVSAAGAVSGQDKPQKVPERTRLLFLMDASGSMLDAWGRNQSKLQVAKSILVRIVDSLRQNNKVELALRLYGHKYPSVQNNCRDSDLEVPFRPSNHQAIIDRINAIRPRGVTPISYALEQAAGDFPQQAGYRNILILITDGIESCGGDPCATSVALQKKGVFLQPYIIGLGLRAEKSLECAGKFLNAETPSAFHDVLNEALAETFSETTVSVLLQGANQKPETNITVSFVNATTGRSHYEFVNYLDRNGRPDSVEVDPLVQYDLVVNTLPPLVRKGVRIGTGTHTTVTIPVLQGGLVVRQEGGRGLQALVRLPGATEVLAVHDSPGTTRYLAGVYDVETLTLPRRTYRVEIAPDRTYTVVVPQPGVVNFSTVASGYGSLFEILPDGSEQRIADLADLSPVFSMTLLPGNYKIAFRVKNSPGSKYTAYKFFTVAAGRTYQVSVFE